MKLDPIALGVALMTSAMTGKAFGFFPALLGFGFVEVV